MSRATATQAPEAAQCSKTVLLIDKCGWSHTFHLAHDIAVSGLRVYLLTDGFYRQSWLPKGAILLPAVPLTQEHIIDSIDSAVRSVLPDVILPVSEDTLFRIWDEAPEWLPLVHPAVEPGLRPLYRSKHLLGAFVHDLGVRIPQTFQLECGSEEEIESLLDILGLPVVVKGAEGVAGQQVRIIDESLDAVRRNIADLYKETGAYPALQQYVCGTTYLAGGLFDHGRPVHMVTAEKTEMKPQRTGPAIALESCCEPELTAAAQAVFSALGHSGIASADFIRDSKGEFYFLEVNPRVWGSYGFAQAIGIDLINSWCKLLQGEALSTSESYPAGFCWTKMPEYLFVPPYTFANVFCRALNPVAIRSWRWDSPRVLIHQLRRVSAGFSSIIKNHMKS